MEKEDKSSLIEKIYMNELNKKHSYVVKYKVEDEMRLE